MLSCNDRNADRKKSLESIPQRDSIKNCICDKNLLDKINNYIDSTYVEEKYKARYNEKLMYLVYFKQSNNDTLVEIEPAFEIPTIIDLSTKEELNHFKGYFKLRDKIIFVFDAFKNTDYTRRFYNNECLTNDSTCDKYSRPLHVYIEVYPYRSVKYKIKNNQLILKGYLPNH
ncbi:MAG TPA: hypothetical protein VGF79_11085 [Bacteroidia bacterium]